MSIEYIRIEPEEVKVDEFFTLIIGVINDRTNITADAQAELKREITDTGQQIKRDDWVPIANDLGSGERTEYRGDFKHYEDENRLHVVITWWDQAYNQVGEADKASVDIKTKTAEEEPPAGKTPLDILFEILGGLLPMPSSVGPPLLRLLGVRWVPKYPGGRS